MVRMIAMKVFERDNHQYLEKVLQLGASAFELHGHTSKPYGGPYVVDLGLWEYRAWAMKNPELVTLIPN